MANDDGRVKFEGAYGERSALGFVVNFPNVSPSEYAPKRADNADALGRMISGRLDSPYRRYALVHRSRTSGVWVPNKWTSENERGGVNLQGHFFDAAREAYNPHVPFALRPEVVWQIIAHEVGQYVKANAKTYSHYFTRNPEDKISLVVPHIGDWSQILLRFRTLLAEHMDPCVPEMFLPRFSTSDVESDVVTTLAFMDTVSEWYTYGSAYCCGFPRILIAGTLDDWKLIVKTIGHLSYWFEPLKPYFGDLELVLGEVVATIDTGHVDPPFWGSMFRHYSNSSPPKLDGWLSALALYRATSSGMIMRDPDEFHWKRNWLRQPDRPLYFDYRPVGLNFVNFSVQPEIGPSIPHLLVGGVIGSEMADGYLTPRVGYAIARIDTSDVPDEA